jgi:hypothetical protein
METALSTALGLPDTDSTSPICVSTTGFGYRHPCHRNVVLVRCGPAAAVLHVQIVVPDLPMPHIPKQQLVCSTSGEDMTGRNPRRI